MRTEDIEFIDQRTLTLLFDAVTLIEHAVLNKSESVGATFARAAIMDISLLLECVSNSCLNSLALPAKLMEELDKLPPISKLDYFLFSLSGKHIDRGCRECELAQNVLKLRDHIVHPKPKRGSVVKTEMDFYVDYGTTKALQIPLDTREWNYEIAIKIGKVIGTFLKRFFIEWCNVNKGRITTILGGREQALVRSGSISWFIVREYEIMLMKKWMPDILEIFDLRAKT